MKKICRSRAEKLYNKGKEIILTPSNCSPTSIFSLIISKQKYAHEFNIVCNSFYYYNCNTELGKRLHYYIED